MAYRKSSRSAGRSRRSYGSRNGSRSGYRSRAVRSTRSRSAGRSRRASVGAGRTIRIEVVTRPDGGVARPEAIGMKAAAPMRRATF